MNINEHWLKCSPIDIAQTPKQSRTRTYTIYTTWSAQIDQVGCQLGRSIVTAEFTQGGTYNFCHLITTQVHTAFADPEKNKKRNTHRSWRKHLTPVSGVRRPSTESADGHRTRRPGPIDELPVVGHQHLVPADGGVSGMPNAPCFLAMLGDGNDLFSPFAILMTLPRTAPWSSGCKVHRMKVETSQN